MNQRTATLHLMRIAGYHNDTKRFTRLYCESRISRPVADQAFQTGVKQRANGVLCNCSECTK